MAEAGAFEPDFVGGFGVTDPLRTASGSDEYFLAGDFHEIDGGTVELAGFAAADFEEIDEIGGQAESGEEAEGAVEEGFEWAGGLVFRGGVGVAHVCNRNPLS